MTARRLTVLVDHPPRELLRVREDADLVLAALALDLPVVVAFVGNGVYHCCRPRRTLGSDPSAVYGSLALYDVERLVVERESLELRGLATAPLRFGVEPVSRSQIGDLLRSADVLL